jgi:hypothetical protein
MPSPTYVPVVQNGGPLSPATLTVSGQTTLDGPVDVNGAVTFDGTTDFNAAVTFDAAVDMDNGLDVTGFTALESAQTSGSMAVFDGTKKALRLGSAGGGLSVKEGANARMGTSVLVAGAVVVPNTSVAALTRIYVTSQVDGGTPGWLRVSARVVGTSFTITSSSGTDTSTVAWLLVESD